MVPTQVLEEAVRPRSCTNSQFLMAAEGLVLNRWQLSANFKNPLSSAIRFFFQGGGGV